MKTALIIGRFQPFHLGHKQLIDTALETHDQVIIIVGSSHQLRNFKNPLLHEERITILKDHYKDQLDRMHIVPMKDTLDDVTWCERVISTVTSIEDNPTHVTLMCHEKDEAWYSANLLYVTETTNLEDSVGGLNATGIRNMIYRNLIDNQALRIPSELIVPEANQVMLSFDYASWETLAEEWDSCMDAKQTAQHNHQFDNPIEPVANLAVIHGDDLILVKRNSKRGYGQLALPGGYIEHTETTRAAALREFHEETGVDLTTVRAQEMASFMSENMDDLGTRTLGFTYMIAVDPEETLDFSNYDSKEVLSVERVPVKDVLMDKTLLFYNHVTIVKGLWVDMLEQQKDN